MRESFLAHHHQLQGVFPSPSPARATSSSSSSSPSPRCRNPLGNVARATLWFYGPQNIKAQSPDTGDGHQRRELPAAWRGNRVTATGQVVSPLQGTQKCHTWLSTPSVPDKTKDILTWTLQSWYLLDVPVQVLLASPLTDFLLNKEMMVRRGAEIIFPCLNRCTLCLCKVRVHTADAWRDLSVSLELAAKASVALFPASSTIPGGIMG